MPKLNKINRREFLNAAVLTSVSFALPMNRGANDGEAKKEERKPKIFFLEGNGRNLELWAIDEGGKDLERITRNEYAEISPVISPNNRFLAYAHTFARNEYADTIRFLDLTNCKEITALRKEPNSILKKSAYNYDYGNIASKGICWSPDNKILAANVYLSRLGDVKIFDNGIELFSFDPTNGQINSSVSSVLSYNPEFLSFSPDSKRVVLGSAWGIEIGDLTISKDGMPLVILNKKAAAEKKEFEDIGRPLWSPRGDFILFDAGGAGIHKNKMYIMKTDGNQIKEIGKIIESEYTLGSPKSWSPDGTRVVYKDGLVKIINVDNMQVVEVAGNYELFGKYNAPCWSKDGKRLAFECGDGIYVANADGSDLKLLKEVRYKEYGPYPNSWNAKDKAFVVGYC